MQLLSAPAYIEAPFIIVKIGQYTFGSYSKKESMRYGYRDVTFPNYMTSINIVKVNGAVNTYTIRMVYSITQFDDPNRIEQVLSTISNTRKIKISYGDWNAPSFIFSEESAIITNVTTSMSASNSQISYVISATSDALYLNASRNDFPKRTAKPSDVIFELLRNKNYGLQDIFAGMRDLDKVESANLIPRDDRKVTIEAKKSVSTLDYLNYLVGCMVPINANDKDNGLTNATHYLHVVDDTRNEFGGAYFKVTRVYSNTINYDPSTTYELDVGFPGNNMVVAFNINNNDSWSILYDYAQEINDKEMSYRINDDGTIDASKEPDLARSRTLQVSTQANKNWWTKVTSFPITATVTIKGLLRPAILMSQVHVNVLFYGKKHISSGLYIITRHEDQIDGSGYRTTLSLTRIGGDNP